MGSSSYEERELRSFPWVKKFERQLYCISLFQIKVCIRILLFIHIYYLKDFEIFLIDVYFLKTQYC